MIHPPTMGKARECHWQLEYRSEISGYWWPCSPRVELEAVVGIFGSRRHRGENYRIRNFKTEEIIPCEIFQR